MDKYEEDKKLPNTAGWLQDADEIGEIRFDFGPGYRIYFCQFKHVLLLLLTGGTKKSQSADIEKAKLIKAQEIARLEAEKEQK